MAECQLRGGLACWAANSKMRECEWWERTRQRGGWCVVRWERDGGAGCAAKRGRGQGGTTGPSGQDMTYSACADGDWLWPRCQQPTPTAPFLPKRFVRQAAGPQQKHHGQVSCFPSRSISASLGREKRGTSPVWPSSQETGEKSIENTWVLDWLGVDHLLALLIVAGTDRCRYINTR